MPPKLEGFYSFADYTTF